MSTLFNIRIPAGTIVSRNKPNGSWTPIKLIGDVHVVAHLAADGCWEYDISGFRCSAPAALVDVGLAYVETEEVEPLVSLSPVPRAPDVRLDGGAFEDTEARVYPLTDTGRAALAEETGCGTACVYITVRKSHGLELADKLTRRGLVVAG